MSRFLVTTALEDTWPSEVPILFLGDWCKIYSRKEFWSKLDAKVMSYHWDDRTQLYKDYLYLKEFYERLLIDLSSQLNRIHGVNHSIRYWRILIGPWLGYFSQMLFDRWVTIQQAVNEYNLSGTILLQSNPEDMVPNDMNEFVHFFVSDEWNHYVYGEIIRETTDLNIQFLKSFQKIENQVNLSFKRKIKQLFVNVFNWCILKFSFRNDLFFISTYLSKFDLIKLSFKLLRIPQFWKSIDVNRSFVSPGMREWILEGESKSDFEKFVRYFIPRQIPKVYLEGYSELVRKTKKLSWPLCPKLIWTSNAHNSDEVFKVWAAANIEKGSKLVIGQHGGHYGIGKWSFNEEHDLEISDCYLSWGWDHSFKSNVYSFGQITAKRPLDVNHFRQTRTLLVTAILPRYSYHMFSSFVAGQWNSYQEDLFLFVNSLPDSIRNTLLIRLHATDYKREQELRWHEKFPTIELNDGQSNINELLTKCRLFISTYNATTFLESFTMNIPTVMFWNPQHWELRDSAIPYFEELKKVGIFHTTPEFAAKHVVQVWDNLEEWWNDKEVQLVRNSFCRRYSHLTDDRLERLKHILRKVK
ncbi:LIC12162 family transferase [Leptospira borgpetersenii]|uniref:LIC12162 family transferase n=1 Tax=Leptospira borgpetersenii TaxID=174 RepID=UPI000297E376|nr:LIC12162 family protein [Leptospira borgpetersenii]EMO10152.1 putative transferase, LIC12162 family [Leptospira borgpetersenii str. Noumea 25]EKR00620.1 transferase, TIGR04331 family [Leptospira borgpetersenii serovar Castellonis str. 200801910]KGE24372.1 transferase [Leptospira borgpetersenii serovar Ballum]MBE8159762.1 transferase [Leptospira borgpetersenii serovar Ballum]MBE8164216.1 transferase [Leptospira borgpetersenii serovar Ballum]